MTTFIIAIILILIALAALVLQKTYFYLPHKELKRQAGHGDKTAKMLFSAAAYGTSLKLLLWGVAGLAAAAGFVLFAQVAPFIFGLVVVALVLWFAFVWLPNTRLTMVGVRLAIWCTPSLAWLLRNTYPVMHRLELLIRRYPIGPHTGLYERDDIYELIEQQKLQTDNRVTDEELELMRRILHFGDYKVRDCLVPSKQVKAVGINENVGPVLMDELHASGHSRFPVYDGKPANIVGTLEIHKVADIKKTGKVRDHYDSRVAYVHENDSLAAALHEFYETKRQLFVVVNSFNEYAGIITIDDILHRLVEPEAHEFAGTHEDRKAVAARHDRKAPEPAREEVETEPAEKLPENPPEVIE